jgi:hypothetical protein
LVGATTSEIHPDLGFSMLNIWFVVVARTFRAFAFLFCPKAICFHSELHGEQSVWTILEISLSTKDGSCKSQRSFSSGQLVLKFIEFALF